MKKFFTLLFLFPLISGAQTFFTTYGGVEYDRGYFIFEDSAGNFIVCGDSGRNSNATYDSQMLLLKADANGNILWVKTYGDTSGQVARCVSSTLDGGYIMHGDQNMFYIGGTESLLLKTDSYGDSLWSRKDYGGMGYRNGLSVLSLADSTFIIGSRNDDIQSYNPYQLMKVDKNGIPLWNDYTDVSYNSGWGSGNSLVRNFDGDLVVAGSEYVATTGNSQIFISSVDSNVNLGIQKFYPDLLNNIGVGISLTADSGYIVAGLTDNLSVGGYDMQLMKLDRNGDSTWTKKYGGSGHDYLYTAHQTSDGGYIAFGHSNSYSNNYDAIILRVNANGDSLWQKSYGGPDDETVVHGIICHDGGYAITGSTKSFGAGNEDVFILKTDSSGNIINSVFEKEANTFIVYPNPFTDHLQLRNIKPFSHLTIYDLMGKAVFEISGDTNEISLNTSEWMTGVYFCRMLFSDGSFKTMKVVK